MMTLSLKIPSYAEILLLQMLMDISDVVTAVVKVITLLRVLIELLVNKVKLNLLLLFSHLADTCIQSDLQMRNLGYKKLWNRVELTLIIKKFNGWEQLWTTVQYI